MRLILYPLLAWLSAGSLYADAPSVALTRLTPVQKLDTTGQPCGVSMGRSGDTYTLDHQDGDNLILKNSTGDVFLVPMAATDYKPPKQLLPNPTSTVSNSAVPDQIKASSMNAIAPSPTNLSAPPVTSSEADKIKQLNEALGLPLLSDSSFWQEGVGDVAKRLDWPEESHTSTQDSFRRYAIKKQIPVCGAGAYSLALYGKDGKPTYLSVIFANAGDFAEARGLENARGGDVVGKVEDDLARAVKKDAETITSALTPLLGNPSISLYGNSSSNRDEVHRWDWQDVAILLNSHQGRYTSLKIVPTTVADHYGTVEVTDRDKMKDMLAQRVEKRDNGDVVLTEMPMVDQGPKGYCVPATWERYLRYMDVPADLYLLAIMGNSGLGGGTTINGMRAGVADYVSAYHRRIEDDESPLDVPHVQHFIDQGLPLMWTCWIDQSVEIQTSKNTVVRKKTADLDAYRKDLAAQDKALGSSFQAMDSARDNGHMRLIIGYNSATDEIAISDSWGPGAAERWLYIPTANRISQGDLTYLSW